MGSEEELRAAAETLDGPAIAWARAIARELGIDLVAGSILERVAGAGEAREHLACTSTRGGEVRAVYRKVHMFDVEVGGRTYRESELEEPGEEIVLSRDRRRRRAGPVDLLRPALPRALPHPRRARRARDRAAGRVHAGDHARSLGDARARARDREPGVRDRRQPGRPHPAGQHSGGRSMIVDPWGVVLAQAPDGEGHIVAELDLERQRGDPRAPALARQPPPGGLPLAGAERERRDRRRARGADRRPTSAG